MNSGYQDNMFAEEDYSKRMRRLKMEADKKDKQKNKKRRKWDHAESYSEDEEDYFSHH